MFRLIRHLQVLVLAKIAALSFKSYPPTCTLSVVIQLRLIHYMLKMYKIG
jgi:hypothetical protein